MLSDELLDQPMFIPQLHGDVNILTLLYGLILITQLTHFFIRFSLVFPNHRGYIAPALLL